LASSLRDASDGFFIFAIDGFFIFAMARTPALNWNL